MHVQITAVNLLRSNLTNSTTIADALSVYTSSISSLNVSSNASLILSINELDSHLTNLTGVDVAINRPNSFLLVKQPDKGNEVFVLGASFSRDNIGGREIDTLNRDEVLKQHLSAAAVLSLNSVENADSINIIIVDKPTLYENVDAVSGKRIASSMILASLVSSNPSSINPNISLYYTIPEALRENTAAEFFCSFYDELTLTWSETGCTKPTFNSLFNRSECSCNHLTSFALVWLPRAISPYLDAQDIASLVFQSVSIACFLLVLAHVVLTQFNSRGKPLRTYDLLPLLSTASSTLLFIFYIAMSMTVYTRIDRGETEARCFQSARVLMFFTYLFFILMLCVKSSVGLFNYLRFVRLFPEPALIKLLIMLIISFFISTVWVSFAAGFDSNSSFDIINVYGYKLCWFSGSAVYYFITIPVCIFLLITLVTFILVARSIISHVHHGKTRDNRYIRLKRCVVILLTSCVTQGIGWLFGPFISLVNPQAGLVLGWFFIVFNGLEGLWSLLLYISAIYVKTGQRLRDEYRIQHLINEDIKSKQEPKNIDDQQFHNDEIRKETRRPTTTNLDMDDFKSLENSEPMAELNSIEFDFVQRTSF